MYTLPSRAWSELASAHSHLGTILARPGDTLTDAQWNQLKTMHLHFGQIIAAGPVPGPLEYPEPTLDP